MSRVRPILFNTEMTEAVLEEWKTATRRIMKPQPWKIGEGEYECRHEKGFFDMGGNDWACRQCGCGVIPRKGGSYFHAPCQTGDILYVRETWTFIPCIDCMEYGCHEKIPVTHEDQDTVSEGCYIYKAGHENPERITWRPSIHMPKTAARIWLKVKDVRVERLHDMNASDLKAEGFLRYSLEDFEGEFDKLAVKFGYEEAKKKFAALWDSTIPAGQQDSYGWEANPWTWVIEFERCRKPEGEE